MKRPDLHVTIGGVVVGELDSYRIRRLRPDRYDCEERQTVTLRITVESDHRKLAQLVQLLAVREEPAPREPKPGQIWRWFEADEDFEVLRVDGQRLWFRDEEGAECFVPLSECTFVREGF